MRTRFRLTAGLSCLLLLTACSPDRDLAWHEEDGYRWAELSSGFRSGTGFARMASSRTGITFHNRLTDQEIAGHRILMNGSGVAAGDVDGDGWVDLYFASLNGPNRLYRNLGGWKFEDVTEAAGVAHEDHYSTGVAFADVDGNGHLDLLVGSVHGGVTLYRNDGTGGFQAVPQGESGLASTAGKGTMTLALADINGNGHLDLYVTNYRERHITDLVELRELTWEHTVEESEGEEGPEYALRPPFDEHYAIVHREGLVPERREVGEPDQLFLNDGTGRFVEADPLQHFLDADGEPMGLDRGWGLAAKFQDLNGNGLPDLYVCNDFWTQDRIWINQGDGTFRELDPLAIRNYSFSSMAVDFSDVDRDGSLDIFVVEMLSGLHERRIRHYVPDGPFPDIRFRTEGQPLYNRNSLYVNRGDGTYAETAYYSEVEASEWSWATQFLDVDLDGYEDILVATGFSYDLQDMDTQFRVNQEIAAGMRPSRGHLVEYDPLELSNVAFRNNGDLTFTETSAEWGLTEEDISHGLALADLDNDGTLDVVFNRLNGEAGVFRNRTTAPRVAIRLAGRAPNTRAIGARIRLEGGPVAQTKELAAGGTYLSSSDLLVVFAANADNPAHTIEVTWPDGALTTVEGVVADRVYEIREPEPGSEPSASHGEAAPGTVPQPTIFEDVSDRLEHSHHEDSFSDWNLQPLLPLALSRQGPGVSWVDLDGTGRDDLLVASGRGAPLGAFRNLGDGRFAPLDLGVLGEPAPGDQTTILGWRDEEGATLLIGSQNLEQGNVGAPAAFHYAVKGGGRVEERGTIPDNVTATGALAAADYTGDGFLDLFVGGRFIPARYPESARSRLFQSSQGGFVEDANNTRALGEMDLGLVTGAVFTDFDGDGRPDLLVSTEWGSLRLLRNDGGRFRDVSEEVGLASYTGWWQGVATGDFTNNGLPDIVAVNLGRNSPYRPLPDRPLRMHYRDFTFDGRVDLLESYWDPVSEAYVPRRQLQELESIWMAVLNDYRSHGEFSTATIPGILGHRAADTPFREISTVEHMVFINRGDHFTAHPLPWKAQLSAGFGVAVGDFDNDGNEDVFLSQNLFSVRHGLPRLDGGRGLWLRGDGEGGFEPVPGHVSGIEVYGEQRGAALADFDGDGRVDLVVTQNAGPTRLFLNRSPRRGIRVRLEGPQGNRDAIGSSMRLVYADGGMGPRREVQAGSGYWSQNSTTQILGAVPGREVEAVEVRWFDGSSDIYEIVDPESTQRFSYPE